MKRSAHTVWYEEYFGPDYLLIDVQEHTNLEVVFLREVLKLKRGSLLLDVGCGYGRHLIPLVEYGVDVVGCDLSLFLLHEAARRINDSAGGKRGEKKSRGKRNLRKWSESGLKLVCSDNRALPFKGVFDCACNMFNSFGYFEEECDNYRMLVSIAEALKPGGLFLIDLINRDFVLRLNTHKDWFECNDAVILEKKWFDPVRNRSEINVTVIDKRGKRSYHHSIRLYSYTEMVMLLEAAGFTVKTVFGGFKGDDFDLNHDRMLILAQTLETEDA